MNDQNETTANSHAEPKLCKMGCGFFVSSSISCLADFEVWVSSERSMMVLFHGLQIGCLGGRELPSSDKQWPCQSTPIQVATASGHVASQRLPLFAIVHRDTFSLTHGPLLLPLTDRDPTPPETAAQSASTPRGKREEPPLLLLLQLPLLLHPPLRPRNPSSLHHKHRLRKPRLVPCPNLPTWKMSPILLNPPPNNPKRRKRRRHPTRTCLPI